jgi:transposase
MKPTNKAGTPAAEPVERRAGAEGNANQQRTHRALNRERVTQALDRVRNAARQRKKERFTALLHHVNHDTLRMAFFALRREAAPGADGLTWTDYEADLEPRLADLHDRVHRGAYRPLPSRRVYIPKADGRQRPLAVAALEDKACPPTCWGGRPHGIACQTWVSSQHPGPEPPMTQYKRIAIDTSKSVFTLHCINQSDLAVLRTNLRRAQMIPFFKKISPTEIAMEACGAAHYWARELTALGHKVRLIPPQYVKPFVKRGKNDRNDAAAICEAAGRPAIHPVPVKTVEQQAQGMVLKIRQTLIGQRVQLTNALRGHAAEFGLVVAKGDSQISRLLFAIEQETAIPPEAKDMLVVLDEQIAHLNSQIKELDVKLAAAHKANPVSRNLATAPGIGPVIGLTMAAKVDPDVFASGRHFAAWVGLAPKEHSTGGKQRMGGISKQGDEGLRALFVNGATAVINAALRPGSKQMTDWLRGMLARKPKKLVAVALANKMARRAWAMMKSSKPYRHPAVPALAVAA